MTEIDQSTLVLVEDQVGGQLVGSDWSISHVSQPHLSKTKIVVYVFTESSHIVLALVRRVSFDLEPVLLPPLRDFLARLKRHGRSRQRGRAGQEPRIVEITVEKDEKEAKATTTKCLRSCNQSTLSYLCVSRSREKRQDSFSL